MRQSFLILSLTLIPLAAAPAAAQEPARRDGSAQRPPAALESLRAGAADDASLALIAGERAALEAASAPSLEALRAHDVHISDHDAHLVLTAAAVVLLLVILL